MKTATEKRTTATLQLTQMISLFVLLIGLFLGSYYWFGGNIFLAAPVGFLIVIAIYYIMQHLIGSRMETKRSGVQIKKALLWPLYFIITIPAMFVVLHMFNVEINEKEEIVELGKSKVECIKGIKTDFKDSYKLYLQQRNADLSTAFTRYLNGDLLAPEMLAPPNKIPQTAIDQLDQGVPENDILNNWYMVKLNSFRKIDSNVLKNATRYLIELESKFDNWDRFALNSSLVQLDEDIERVYTEYSNALKNNADGRRMLPVDDKYKSVSLLEDPVSLMKKHFGLSSILLILVVQFLILLPYFLAPKREYQPVKKNGKYEPGSEVINVID